MTGLDPDARRSFFNVRCYFIIALLNWTYYFYFCGFIIFRKLNCACATFLMKMISYEVWWNVWHQMMFGKRFLGKAHSTKHHSLDALLQFKSLFQTYVLKLLKNVQSHSLNQKWKVFFAIQTNASNESLASNLKNHHSENIIKTTSLMKNALKFSVLHWLVYITKQYLKSNLYVYLFVLL